MKGDSGAVGPQGPKGDTGAAGAAGAQGPQGPSGVVSTNSTGAYDFGNNNGFVATGSFGSGNLGADGSGTRLMWYPNKAAFRSGHVDGTQWDDANIGSYSTALGYNARASGDYALAAGNSTTAANTGSVALGDNVTATGAASVALGFHASTNARQGSFVFGDRSTNDSIRAGVNHSANWRVSGGFRIFTASDLSTGVTIQSGLSTSNWGQSNAVISTSTGAYLSTGGVWTNNSDVNGKHGFADVSGEDVLARLRGVPVLTWSYNDEGNGVRHMGPMAQTFYAAFGLGPSERSIPTVDADGVALAAAKALDARTAAQQSQIDALRAENAAQAGQIAGLRAAVERLESLVAPKR